MKAKLVSVVAIMVVSVSVTMASIGFWPWANPTPELEFKTENGEVTAYLTLDINNSPAVVDTSIVFDHKNKTATLGFVVLQNPDLYRRSVRQIKIDWQVGKIDQEDYTFHVEGCNVTLTTDKLKTLSPKEDG